MLSSTDGLGTQQVGLDESREDVFPFFCREPTQMSSLPQESGVALHHRSLPALRVTSAARRKAMGIGGGAVLFFADDGDGLAGELDD